LLISSRTMSSLYYRLHCTTQCRITYRLPSLT